MIEDPFAEAIGPPKTRHEALLRQAMRGMSSLEITIKVQLILMKSSGDAGQEYAAAAHYYKLCELLDRYARESRSWPRELVEGDETND
jgi:hypothetical protein